MAREEPVEIKARPPVTAPAATEPTSSAIDERLLQFRALEEARKEREELERKKRLLDQQRLRQEQESEQRLREERERQELAERRAAEDQLRIARERAAAEGVGRDQYARAPADEGRWERARPPQPAITTRQPAGLRY